MKKFVLACGAALLMTGLYVWGSYPSGHFSSANHQYGYSKYVTDTIPKKDTTKRKDSLQ